MASLRTNRIESLLKKDLGEILLRRFQHNNLITVTNVVISPDLSIAKVYLSIMAPGSDPASVFENLVHRTSAIRKELGNRVRHQLRKVPELHFFMDDTAEYASKLDKVFQDLHKKDNSNK